MDKHPSQWTDAELVDRLRVRDLAAENELLTRYGQKLITHLMSGGFRYHDAEDLAYEAIYKANDALDSYRTSKGAFSTWLFQIAKNKAADFLKRPQHRWYREKVISLNAMFQTPGEEDRSGDHLDGADLTELHILSDNDAEADDQGGDDGDFTSNLVLPRDRSELPYKDMAEVVKAVLQQKPAVQRAFELRYKENLPPEEAIQCLLKEGLYHTHSAAESAIARLKGKVEKALRTGPHFKHLFPSTRLDLIAEDNEPPDKTLTAD